MSQPETPNEKLRQQRRELLLDLARQAEARKHQVKQMLAQCAGNRDSETQKGRIERQQALQKISAEVRKLRESSHRPEDAEAPAPPLPAISPSLSVPPIPPSAPPRIASLSAASVPAVAPPPSVAPPAPPPASPPPPPAAPARTSVEIAFESRMSGLEDAFAKLVETVTEKLDYSSRFAAVESQSKQIESSLEALSQRLAPIENKYEVLRGDLRAVESAGEQWKEQFKSFDQIFASLGRDSQKLGAVVDSLSAELRSTQDRQAEMTRQVAALESTMNSELQSMQERVGRFESGLVRAIGLLQSSEQGIAELSNLRERFSEMETGFHRVLKAVETLEKPVEVSDTAAEREATANVLASLTKLVQGMRAAQAERQTQEGARIA